MSSTLTATTEEPYATSVDPNRDNLTTQDNRGGWVNPEDFPPMPQCIAQQDPSNWLSTMTECTGKKCTRHFGVICTHHQWLTQASCLSTGFSPDVVEPYLPYCSRSVLAKAQLYRWIHAMTGRTWLVDVGDANELQSLSPASLSEGYAAVNVTHHAPTCLTASASARSMEPFEHVMASCSFTSTTQHTGRADRPWEYRQDLHSMVALDFETVGYDLTGGYIRYGDYFDRECFCRAFAVDTDNEPCSVPGTLEWTQQQLWMSVTCGPWSLPDNWEDSLKTTGFAYISMENWHWPSCVKELPERVTRLVQHCATDACGIDSDGYCKVKHTVDRSCMCRNLSFETCGDSCQNFEARISYANWLHDLCGKVQDWHGLPDNWRELAAPTVLEMIPWQWTIKPSTDESKCGSNSWILGSFILVNVATLIAALNGRAAEIHGFALRFPRLSQSSWFATGISIAGLQLLVNWINALLIQGTLGFEDIPVTQLMFLWCSMPRLAWLTFLLIGLQPFDEVDFSAAKASLFAEITLQVLSAYYMVFTVSYGFQHNFYFRSLDGVKGGQSARLMYAGALLWLVIITVTFVWSIRVALRMVESGSDDSVAGETSSLLSGTTLYAQSYGAIPGRSQGNSDYRTELAVLYEITAISMFLLWIAQWLFWGGFIDLTSEEYVFRHIFWPCS